jgi:hypothetical protein
MVDILALSIAKDALNIEYNAFVSGQLKQNGKTMKWNWFFEHLMLLVDNIFH